MGWSLILLGNLPQTEGETVFFRIIVIQDHNNVNLNYENSIAD